MSSTQTRRRLQEAALTLFLEHGFERTTAAEIAASIGVTERTFFRYFPDKREVLFDEAALNDTLRGAIASAPEGMAPMEILHAAFRSLIPLLEANRPLTEPSQALIANTPALLERHLAKVASTTAIVAQALRDRGVDADKAPMAAAMGMAIIGQAVKEWLDRPALNLAGHLAQAIETYQSL